MRRINTRAERWLILSIVLASTTSVALQGWGEQGHRLVADLATRHLTPIAKQNVAWLLDNRPLADIASWADEFRGDNNQTEWWHFMNIPPAASGYDRDRDCPRQAGVEAGSRGDRWRDCIVDRILYNQERLANTTLDRPDRAIALKYVVHFVGDLHQPFHTLGVGRGGNDVHVTVFGSSNCSNNPSRAFPCNLHSVWDSMLITHRGWNDQQWITAAESLAAKRGLFNANPGTPAEWGTESFHLAKAALVPDQGTIDEAYYAKNIGVIEERIALAGARLAALLNKSLTTAPPH
jgi:nuclease S1